MSDTSIVVFTRLPRPGQAKTRLIPVLGAEGAAQLQERMSRQAVGRASAHCLISGHRLVVAYEGATGREMRSWLGPAEYREQSGGDLGDRLRAVIKEEFQKGSASVIVIGADCPALEARHLRAAESALENADAVFGPAEDGGYYLIGLRRSDIPVFSEIPWGKDGVLDASLRAVEAAGFRAALIERLSDVDEAADLSGAKAALEAGSRVSVVVPAWNEETNLDRLLPLLGRASPHEILIADGGSTDRTVSVAESYGARVIRAPRGRAFQMNAAASAATGEYLLFLHADTEPPEDWAAEIPARLGRAGVAGGAFRFTLREPVTYRRAIESLVKWRCRLFSLPYGDQGIFVRRDLFYAVGGYPDWPILEDVELIKRLRRLGRIDLSDLAVRTSSRRWQESGPLSVFLRHQAILCAHAFGVSPTRLGGWR